MIDWTGQKVGNYKLLRSIGNGGFADVYLGQHAYLQTHAAIKILQSRLAQNELDVFLNEARTIANLAHPHIVRVLEFGEEGHTPYLVMDYYANGSLRQRHPKGARISLPECVLYVKQIARALQYAHERRIIHRDVKAENILIGHDGSLLLGDFGIAIISQSSRYSHHQELGGTIAYTAPEQLQGKATVASDQYALGILTYEWLTGELPFKGSFPEIASQHLLAPVPSLRAKVPEFSAGADLVLQKALAKDPAQRFDSVQSFAAALEQAAGNTFSRSTALLASENQEQRSVFPSPLSTAPTILENQELISTFIPAPSVAPTMRASSSIPQNAVTSNRWTIPPAHTAFTHASYEPPQTPKTRKLGAVIAGLLILVLLLSGVSVWALTRPNGNANMANRSGNTPQNNQGGSPTTTFTPLSTAPVRGQIIHKNLRLSCTCDDPIALKINTITIDPGKGNMTWMLSFTNVGGEKYQVHFNDFHLSSALNGQEQTYTASGPIMQGYSSPIGVLTNGLNPGQSVQTPVIFAFVPLQNTQYTLNAWILNDGNTYVSIEFDPATLTFP